jgi:hypothetical protein
MLSRSDSSASTLIDARLPDAPDGRATLSRRVPRLPGGRPRLFARFAIASTSHVRIGLASLTDTIFEGNGRGKRNSVDGPDAPPSEPPIPIGRWQWEHGFDAERSSVDRDLLLRELYLRQSIAQRTRKATIVGPDEVAEDLRYRVVE